MTLLQMLSINVTVEIRPNLFHVSTFYKKIVYGQLIKVCNQLIDCYCKGGYREFISANGKWSFMGKKRMPKVLVFPNSTGKKFVKYLP